MALNWVMLSPQRQPIPLQDELDIRTIDSGVELTLLIPDALPAGSSTSGGSGGSKKLKENGMLKLTDKRLVFISETPTSNGKVSFESLTVGLTSVLATKFEQPYLGNNYLVLEIQPVPNSGLTEGTKAEIRFKNKGLFEFASALDKTRERAVYMKRQSADEEEGLPSYSSSSAPTPGPSSYEPLPPAVPGDAPPGYDD